MIPTLLVAGILATGAVRAGNEPLPKIAPIGLSKSETPEGQLTQEYKQINSRIIRLPIKYEKDRKTIRQVLLFVAHNGENIWYQEASVTSDRDEFLYTAKEDGIYWFTMVVEDLQGRRDPFDIIRMPPDLKVIVDTVPPRVRFTAVQHRGENVVVMWLVDDKYPDENKTRVHFHATGSADSIWQEVSLPISSKFGVRFAAGTTGPVTVRVTAFDLAGNKTEAFQDVSGSTTDTPSSTGVASTPNQLVSPAGGVALPRPRVGSLAGGVNLPLNRILEAKELDEELTRLELELIHKELKRLAEEKGLSPDVEQKIDRLRDRLRNVQERLARNATSPGGSGSGTLPTSVDQTSGTSSNDYLAVPETLHNTPLPPYSLSIPHTQETPYSNSNDSTVISGAFRQLNPAPPSFPSPIDGLFAAPPSNHLPAIPSIPVPSLPVAPEPRMKESR
jgi:hypothetical protein